jgi:Zn-dependent protease with chaperone function
MMSVLFESSIRAALAAAGVAVILHLLRIAAPRARHAAWCAVLAAMLLLPAFSAFGPKAALRVLPPLPVVPLDTGAPWTPTASAPVPAAPPVAAPAAHIDLLAAAWLLVAALLLLRLFHGAARAAAIRRRALHCDGFLTSPDCACPITLGWWRPAIVLPSSWPEWPAAELRAVLAHERAHVRRRDPLIHTLAAFNRCIFWFHPLAWWLEHRLAALAEEACDAAAIASGLDPHDYSECLIRQARAVERAGARIAVPGSAIGGGVLSRRIRLLLDPHPAPAIGRVRAALASTLCLFAVTSFSACTLDRAEKPLAGQPTMNELAHRRAESNRQYQDRQRAIRDRARALDAVHAATLLASLKQNPTDDDAYWTLVRYYQGHSDAAGLDALKLWYIEHDPAGKLSGAIDPRIDRAAYERGKALWLGHLKQPGASAEIYRRAADFFEGGDMALAESTLEAGRKAYPDDPAWPSAFGRIYARALPDRLATSRDAAVLAQAARYLVMRRDGTEYLPLARTYLDRALAIDPDNRAAQSVRTFLAEIEQSRRLQQLEKLSPAERAAAPASDRILLASFQMREAAIRQNFDGAAAKARELLDLATRNAADPLAADAAFEANMVLGKAALHHGDRKTAARYLLAAADTPASERIRRGDFEMNLPRALIDWGERRAVADFYRRMAPKTARSKQFEDWAADIAKGINPDLIPTFSAPNCTSDPC